MSYIDLGQRIKAKHPEYQDMDDVELGKRMVQKYPEYSDFADDNNKRSVLRDILDLPSQVAGGMMEAGKQVDNRLIGANNAYQAPQTGIKLPANRKGVSPDLGEFIPPFLVGAVRGVQNQRSVMDELPRAVNVDPNSGKGMAIGLAGELAIPDTGDLAMATKFGQKAVTKGEDVVKKLFNAAGERTAQAGIKLNPSQGAKFYNAVKKNVGKYIADEGLAGNVADNVSKRITKLQTEYDDIAFNSGIKVSTQDLGNAGRRVISQLDDRLRGVVQKDEIDGLQSFIADLGKKVKGVGAFTQDGKAIDVGELVDLRRVLDDRIPESQWAKLFGGDKVNKDMKARMYLQELINESVAGVTSESGKTLQKIGQELKPLYMLGDMVQKQSFLGQGARLIGLSGVAGAALGFGSGDTPQERVRNMALFMMANRALGSPKVLGTASQAAFGTAQKAPKIIDPLLRLGKEMGLSTQR